MKYIIMLRKKQGPGAGDQPTKRRWIKDGGLEKGGSESPPGSSLVVGIRVSAMHVQVRRKHPNADAKIFFMSLSSCTDVPRQPTASETVLGAERCNPSCFLL